MTDPETTAGRDGERQELVFIACPAVLGELAEGAAAGADVRELEAQLHVKPDRLKEALRAAVAEADQPGVTIVLGYGLCSNSVLGLKTEHATLVVPRVDDCIAMLLGSNEAFSMEAEKERGSYYLAKAYMDECANLVTEHEAMVQKYGSERAVSMMKLVLKHYKRVVLVDTGRYDIEPLRERVREVAELYGLAIEEAPGTTRIVDGLVADEWGDDFVVAPPGHELTLRDFRPELFKSEAGARRRGAGRTRPPRPSRRERPLHRRLPRLRQDDDPAGGRARPLRGRLPASPSSRTRSARSASTAATCASRASPCRSSSAAASAARSRSASWTRCSRSGTPTIRTGSSSSRQASRPPATSSGSWSTTSPSSTPCAC